MYTCTLELPVRPVSQLKVDNHPAIVLSAQPALAAPGHVQLPHTIVRGLESNIVDIRNDTIWQYMLWQWLYSSQII